MDGEDRKNEVARKTSLEDLERVVKMRKYQHCEAEYSRLAKEPNTMAEVRDRYLRIAQYYRELADTEPAGARAAKRDNFQTRLPRRAALRSAHRPHRVRWQRRFSDD